MTHLDEHGDPTDEDEEVRRQALAEAQVEAHYADDPDAPYFEHLYAVARMLKPNITRAETLTLLREVDPDDTLRIGEPL